MAIEKIPVYCYQCVAGPDLLKVVVKDGIAVGVEPNRDMADDPPRRRQGLRARLRPRRRSSTTRRVSGRRCGARTRARAVTRIQAGSPSPGTRRSRSSPTSSMASRAGPHRRARLSAPRRDVRLGRHRAGLSRHLRRLPGRVGAGRPGHRQRAGRQVLSLRAPLRRVLAPRLHRRRRCARCDFVLSFGYNGDASGGVTGVFRHAEARVRGLEWVQFEPHLSVTGAGATEWVPVRPKTDAAVLFALLHVILREHDWRAVCDVPFLEHLTSSPYLVGPGGTTSATPKGQAPGVGSKRERRRALRRPRCARRPSTAPTSRRGSRSAQTGRAGR